MRISKINLAGIILAFMALIALILTATLTVGPATPVPLEMLEQIYARFEPEHPGRGVTDYPNNTSEDIPKAYAMILLAEVDRARFGLKPELPSLANVAGNWLLDNAKLNKNGLTGWGVPVAWDAYGDGSENPSNAIYSISTAIAIDALLSWMETSQEAPHERILATVEAAIQLFLKTSTPSGLFPYSLEEADKRYDTYNAAAYLAGQVQRFSLYVRDQQVARTLRSKADETFTALISYHRVTDAGHWYWYYSAQETTANDLPHASYIIDGLKSYVRYGGVLAPEIDLPAVIGHFSDFLAAGKPRAWPSFQADITLPPRLYDIGIALHMTCHDPEAAPLAKALLNSVKNYKDSEGRFAKYPLSLADQEPLIVNEYEAYLWRGMVSCAAPVDSASSMPIPEPASQAHPLVSNPLDLKPYRVPLVADLLAAPRIDGPVTVPFVILKTDGAAATVAFDLATQKATLSLDNLQKLQFDKTGIPVALRRTGETYTIIFRAMPTNTLWLVDWDTGKGTQTYKEISRGGVDYLLYRQSLSKDDMLDLIIYDYKTERNYLRRYIKMDGGWIVDGNDIVLPTLEDPAGTHYELEPPLFLFVNNDTSLRIVGGTLDAIVTGGKVTESRINDCERVLEAVSTPAGIGVLCNAKLGKGYLLYESGKSEPIKFGFSSGVPYNIAWDAEHDRLGYRIARGARDLTEMFAFDISRSQNGGFLDFGSDNIAGRIPWSQVYYLNGLMDAALLTRRDDDAFSVFSPLLKQIRLRIEFEIRLLDASLSNPMSLSTRAFTHDHSLAVFAVQTSRILLLLNRYKTEFPSAKPLINLDRLRQRVSELTGHIEVLGTSGDEETWLKPGKHHLRWPKGSAFYFDGVAVPYNHQNEWAYSLFETYGHTSNNYNDPALTPQREIIQHYLDRLASDGSFPSPDRWSYWWGHAYDGYDAASGLSVNTPTYPGDKSLAWISFRTIDLMSVLSAVPFIASADVEGLRNSAARRIEDGDVYPFAFRSIMDQGYTPRFDANVIYRYMRSGSPGELANVPWALSTFLPAQDPPFSDYK